MDKIIWKPLSAEDYEKADKIMYLLMQSQVRTLLDFQPGRKEKVKTIQGMLILPDEFTNQQPIGSVSPPKTQLKSGCLSSADLTTRITYNPKDVEKDTQWKNNAAQQLVCMF